MQWKMRTKESPEQSLKDFSCKRTLLLLLLRTRSREGSQREGQAHRGRPMPRPSVRTAPAPSRNALRGLRLSATPGCGAQPLTAKPGGSCGSPRPAVPATPPAVWLLPAALPNGAASAGMTRTDAGARPCRAKAGDLPPGTPARLQPHHTELLQPPGRAPRTPAAPEDPSVPASAPPSRGDPRIGSDRPSPAPLRFPYLYQTSSRYRQRQPDRSRPGGAHRPGGRRWQRASGGGRRNQSRSRNRHLPAAARPSRRD